MTVTTVFLAGFLATSILRPSPLPPPASLPDQARELALILITSTDCAPSRDPELPAAWSAIVTEVSAVLPDSVPLRTIGINIARDVQAGAEFLRAFGDFHEVLLGGGIRNTGSLRYVLDSYQGPRITPQVVLVERSFAPAVVGEPIQFNSERVILRVRGSNGILFGESLLIAAASVSQTEAR